MTTLRKLAPLAGAREDTARWRSHGEVPLGQPRRGAQTTSAFSGTPSSAIRGRR